MTRPATAEIPAPRVARQDFVLRHTAPLPVPFVPELRLRQASEAFDLWHATERELEAEGLPPPFWAFAWAGGQGLARFILDRPEWVRNRRVIDVAGGSGLVALAAVQAGARSVASIDVDPFAAEAARLNAALNGFAIRVRTGDPIGRRFRHAQTLLAGDVFYDRPFAERLVPWFDALASQGTTVIVGDPERAYLPRDRVEPLATYEVPTPRVLEDAERKTTRIWRWRAPPG